MNHSVRLLLPLASTLLILACGGGGDDDGQNVADAAAGTDAVGASDAADVDATPITSCAEDLVTQADGSAADETNPNVVISEIVPGEFIEVYNAGSAAVMLGSTGYSWCNNRRYPSFATLNVEVAAKGRRTIPWPGGNGVEAGGDVSIYSRAIFNGGQANILDYVCWGTPAAGGATRLTDATAVGKWNGDCAPVIPAGGSLARLVNQDGTEATDYATQAAPTLENCE